MSYNISLNCPCCGRTVMVSSHEEGGTFVLGGTNYADLNVTYNYSKDISAHLDGGLQHLEGMDAKNAIPLLEKAVNELGTERDNDYWKPTPGNAGYALSILLKWAKQHPNAVFSLR